jgi:3D (Asp-Asp-Asp) domain-containing protein
MAGLAVATSLGFAGAIRPEAKDVPAARIVANETLSTPVNRGGYQPDLSPELMHDVIGSETNGKTRAEATEPLAASAVALFDANAEPGPALRGLYTGAARTLIQSHGKSRIVWLEVTAYCPCPKCCGPAAAGVTASGKPVSYNGGAFVAADEAEFDFGVNLHIPGYHDGQPVEVIDRGSAIKHAKLDVYFPTHEQAEEWGRQWLPVVVGQE